MTRAVWPDLATIAADLATALATITGFPHHPDQAPATPTGPYVVVAEIDAPRTAPTLLAGLTTAVVQLQLTCVSWDATKRISVPEQARRLAEKELAAVAGTNPDGSPAHALTLPGLIVVRREGQREPVTQAGQLWQCPVTVTLHVQGTS